MKYSVGITILIAATGAQASHWVPVTKHPDGDMVGLYIDKDSIKGTFTARRASEKFVNSYREETLYFVEMNCEKNSWRALRMISRAPTGMVLKSDSSPNAKSKPIKSDPLQKSARAFLCKSGNPKR